MPVVYIPAGGGGGGGGGNFGGGGGGNIGGGGGNIGGGGGGNIGGGGGQGTGVGGLSYINPSTSAAQSVAQVAQQFFTSIGVFTGAGGAGGAGGGRGGVGAVGGGALPAGRSIAFNDKLGLLFVKATPGELDAIERVVQSLNQQAPQVHIKTRFIEVGQDDNTALGFDWYLGNFINGNVVANGGSAPSLTVPTSAANPLGAFPGNTAANLIAGSATDQQCSPAVCATPARRLPPSRAS